MIVIVLFPFRAMAQEEEIDNENDSAEVAVDTIVADTTSLPWPANICKRLDKICSDPMMETSQLGLMVYDLTADSVIYKRGERQTLRPASTMKLVTAISSIDRLGGSYQFKTSLYYKGKIENHTLSGDIYCVGGFDPRFNSDDMRAFVEGITQMDIDTIRGCIYADVSMKDTARLGEGWCWDDDNPILSPLLISRKDNFVERFRDDLRESGVVVNAITAEGKLPHDAKMVCSRSHTIDQILMKMMKESDNLYAEALFYQLAASSGEQPAKAKHARSIIKRLLSKLGIDSGYRIADGSGLSLYNYVNASLEVGLLKYAYSNSNIYMHLYPSLPIAGQDGTLKRRMKGSFTSGNVHAKTGTLEGVISLAGYLTSANGHVIAFSILNQGVMHARNARRFQDRICVALCEP